MARRHRSRRRRSRSSKRQRRGRGTIRRLKEAAESLARGLHVFVIVHPRRAFAVAATSTVALVLTMVGLNRVFSVSCEPNAPCVTFVDLREGVPLPEALRIYDREGELLAEVAGPLRRALTREEVPELLADGFVAVEDRRFWEHTGVDARGAARAAVRNLLKRDVTEGASTIPMQLVRTIWSEPLREVGRWRRKVIETRMAPRLIEELGHERVLTLYLNAIYLGNGIYGVERASEHYFGVGVAELDIGQIATLVGITRSPEFYEPRRHPERALSVRGVVLDLFAAAGLITAEEAALAAETDLSVVALDTATVHSTERNHFTAAVTREVRRVAPELAGLPGLAIFTTLDPIVQSLGEAALQEQLDRIEVGNYGPLETVDSLTRLEGAAVALDPASGAVLAWVGGRDFSDSEFDRVDQARRQVGSLVKPFLVAMALERGFGMVDMVSADTVAIPTNEGAWLPADHIGTTSLPLREALVHSSNRAAAHLGISLGLETVTQIGTRVGIDAPIPPLPSSSIGAFEASLLEMTGAYATLGNGGHRVGPYFLQRIEGPDGSVLWSRPDTIRPARVITDAQAFVVLDAMRSVVDRGTGYSVRARGYRGPAAGKTGTTNDGRDAWFVGLTPEMVAGVWIGFDQPQEIVPNGSGGMLAAPAWGTWMERLRRSSRPRTGMWVPPVGVERVLYDVETGEVLGLECRGQVVEGLHKEAWVMVGEYQRADCLEAPRGLLQRLWRAVVPGDSERIKPVRRRRPPGG